MGKTTKDIFLRLSISCGYCCAYSFIRGNAQIRTGLLAATLGIEPRTLRKWRRAFKTQVLTPCPDCPPKGRDILLRQLSASDASFVPGPRLSRRKRVS